MGESSNHSILLPSPWWDEIIGQPTDSHSLCIVG